MSAGHIDSIPLIENEFTRGKGVYKLVQYMSIGLPGIGYNVGFNQYVLYNGTGVLVNDRGEWINAILNLLNVDNWLVISKKAFLKWKESFSYESNLYSWKELIM